MCRPLDQGVGAGMRSTAEQCQERRATTSDGQWQGIHSAASSVTGGSESGGKTTLAAQSSQKATSKAWRCHI